MDLGAIPPPPPPHPPNVQCSCRDVLWSNLRWCCTCPNTKPHQEIWTKSHSRRRLKKHPKYLWKPPKRKKNANSKRMNKWSKNFIFGLLHQIRLWTYKPILTTTKLWMAKRSIKDPLLSSIPSHSQRLSQLDKEMAAPTSHSHIYKPPENDYSVFAWSIHFDKLYKGFGHLEHLHLIYTVRNMGGSRGYAPTPPQSSVWLFCLHNVSSSLHNIFLSQ